jgi:pectinesterase
MHRLIVLLCAFTFTLTLSVAAQTAKPPKFQLVKPETPAGFTLKTLDVAAYPEHTVQLHVYVPDKPGAYPCILDIHGGGWQKRQIESDKPMMERLAQRGFVTALVTYRLAQEAKYPAAIEDVRAALRTLRAKAPELHIDPARIGCIGGSAGGHLSGLTAMTSGITDPQEPGPHLDQSSAVQAAIVMAATQDLTAANKEKTSENAIAFFGGTYAEKPDLYAAASPITHVRPNVPPTIFIEGERDTLKIGRAEMMEKLKAAGVETALHTLPQAPHPFWMSQPWLDQVVDIAAPFFKKHLGEPQFTSAKASPAKPEKPKFTAYTTPEEAAEKDPDFAIQGEFTAALDDKRWGVQIWAMGKGEFEVIGYQGGLPGDGWDLDRSAVTRSVGRRDDTTGKVVFESPDRQLRAEVTADLAEVFDAQGTRIFELIRAHRNSPTEDAPPPARATVLFDGKGINRFPNSRVTEDGLLMEGVTSQDKFQDFTAHIEFRLPFMPDARGQARGNSGIYLQGRYEVQMLDSFGLEGKDNECGGLYKISAPRENLCFPPLTWQTYDIDFTAAKWDAAGKKTANARITVKHNGVTIQDNVELPGDTGSAPVKEANSSGPIFLQNHGNPVRYRNIWVLPKK